ncbi:hypothetical protein QVD17_28707 [Tagetes erecta]|uniref:SET domain-containing protein n=1 Tax=Tagetes erecta TaxID=13708 RepID=A0AAD8KBC8_TARER|nr:hypothetical protein QVD17_28707 [Tagetes erecta]
MRLVQASCDFVLFLFPEYFEGVSLHEFNHTYNLAESRAWMTLRGASMLTVVEDYAADDEVLVTYGRLESTSLLFGLLQEEEDQGAHESEKLGEDPIRIPNNLMPYIQQVVVGCIPELNVYGHYYSTRDDTTVQDYIHVMDLADDHAAALKNLFTKEYIALVIELPSNPLQHEVDDDGQKVVIRDGLSLGGE